MSTLETALIISVALSIWVVLGAYVVSGLFNPLMTGLVTGIVLGNPILGLTIGGTCTLMSIGFYTYGGAVVPSYTLGAVLGVAVAVKSGDYNQGIVIGSVIALLGSWFDILQGMMATAFIHGADKALARNSIKGFERWHLNGIWTIVATNFVPMFVGLMLIDKYTVISDFVDKYAWFQNGISVIGAILPAVGFALLLSYMDIKRYWPFMILGYVLFAYLGLPTMGLAFVGIALGYLYAFKIKKVDDVEAVNESAVE